MQTQNRVNVALPRLPPEVQRQGVTVEEVSSAFLMAVALVSKDQRYDSLFLTNYAQINLVNQLGSIAGCGRIAACVRSRSTPCASGLIPDRMIDARVERDRYQQRRFRRKTGRIPRAPSGRRRTPQGTDFQYAVSAPGRLTDPSQFEDIVIRAQPDASLLARARYRPSRTWRAELWRLQPLERPALRQRHHLSFRRARTPWKPPMRSRSS